MALEKGGRVIFTKDPSGILRPFVRKGTEGTVTKAGGWGSDTEVTLENGTKLTVSQDEISKSVARAAGGSPSGGDYGPNG